MHCRYDSSHTPPKHTDTLAHTWGCTLGQNCPQRWLWIVIPASASTATSTRQKTEGGQTESCWLKSGLSLISAPLLCLSAGITAAVCTAALTRSLSSLNLSINCSHMTDSRQTRDAPIISGRGAVLYKCLNLIIRKSATKSFIVVVVSYSAPVGVRSIVINQSVCVSVCLWAYLWNHWSNQHKNFCADPLWPWLRPPPVALRYVMYFRFYGWRHIWT